jgi:hypothetical protein
MCGYPVERTLDELKLLPEMLPWTDWPAVQAGRVYMACGNAYFNRSGPGSSTRPSCWPAACIRTASATTVFVITRPCAGSTPTSRCMPGAVEARLFQDGRETGDGPAQLPAGWDEPEALRIAVEGLAIAQ